MGKGSKKKTKKKKKKPIIVGATASYSTSGMGISEPPRVTNDLDISVRKQIRIAQLKKGTTNMHTGQAFRQNN